MKFTHSIGTLALFLTSLPGAGLALARELKPAPLPQRPLASPFVKGVWGFGNVPPQLK